MGYGSRVSGRISIEPPVGWQALKQYLSEKRLYSDIELVEEVIDVETEEGTLRTRRAVTVAAYSTESAPFYNMVEALQTIVESFPNHTFGGYLDREGEENGDMERYRVNPTTRKVETLKPTIVWDETQWTEAESVVGCGV